MAETDKNKKPFSYSFKPSLTKTLSPYNILKVKPHERKAGEESNQNFRNITREFLETGEPIKIVDWLREEIQKEGVRPGKMSRPTLLWVMKEPSPGQFELLVGIEHRHPEPAHADDPKKTYGHPTISLSGVIAGEVEIHEEIAEKIEEKKVKPIIDRIIERVFGKKPEKPEKKDNWPGEVEINNKSRRLGTGSKLGRIVQDTSKEDLMNIAINKFTEETDMPITLLRLRRDKPLRGKIFNPLLKKLNLIPKLDKWGVEKVKADIRPVAIDAIKTTITELASMDQAAIDKKYTVNVMTDPESIAKGSLGALVKRDEDGTLYFQKALQQRDKTFNKIPGNILGHIPISISDPTTTKVKKPKPEKGISTKDSTQQSSNKDGDQPVKKDPTIMLTLGLPPTKDFKNAVAKLNPTHEIEITTAGRSSR